MPLKQTKQYTVHRVANQTSEEFNNCINKQKKQNAVTIGLVSMKMYVKLRSKMFGSCIHRNRLIEGNLTCVEGY